MKTNQSNDSFQAVRVFCSKAKTRLFLLAFLPCLTGSVCAGSLTIDLSMPDALIHFKGSLVAVPDSTPFGPRIMPRTPDSKPGPTPLGTPYAEPPGRRK